MSEMLANERRRMVAAEHANGSGSGASILSIVPVAGDLKLTVLFNAVATSERLSALFP
jgi:hypothetical protein